MVTFPEGYWIIKNWVSKAQLFVQGKEVRFLPIQTDQRSWQRPGNDADVVKPPKLVDTLAGYRHAYGGVTFVWALRMLSPLMIKYLFQNYFDSRYSNNFTVQTYNRQTGEWESYQCIGRYPDVTADAELQGGGLDNFKVNFVAGKPAPEGPDLSINATYPALKIELASSFSVNVINIGDAATFTATTVNYALPTGFVFVSTSSPNWTPTYSINNGLSYNATPPVDPTTVTNVRWVYAVGFIPAGGGATVFTVMIIPTQTTPVTSVISVTSVGDFNTTNNTDTEIVTPSIRAYNRGFGVGFS
jgi:hypothetical protein